MTVSERIFTHVCFLIPICVIIIVILIYRAKYRPMELKEINFSP